MNQKSYAKIAEALAKKESKYQKLLDEAKTDRDKTAAQRMLDRVSASREQLMADNKAIAEEKNSSTVTPQFGWGGLLDMVKGASGGGDDFDTAFAAAGGNDPSRLVDLGTIGGNGGGILSKLGGLFKGGSGEGLLGTAGKVAPFLDNLAMKKYINSVKPNSRPELQTAPNLKTDFNINPQLIDAKNASRVLNKSIDNSSTNRGAAHNRKIAGHAQTLNVLNGLRGRKENIETQLKNNAALQYNNINNNNIGTMNDHRQSLIDFNNQKQYMKYANTANVGSDIMDINAQKLKQKEQQQMLEVLKPYYNRFNLGDKYYPGIFKTMMDV